MKKKVLLKQENQFGNTNMPEQIEIVGEDKRIYEDVDFHGNIESASEEDVYITSDMRNYPKEIIKERYNI